MLTYKGEKVKDNNFFFMFQKWPMINGINSTETLRQWYLIILLCKPQGREKSPSHSQLTFIRICQEHERHVFKDVFCLSSLG